MTGNVEYIFNNGKTVLVGFAYPHQGIFKAQIPQSVWESFGLDFGQTMGRNRESLVKEGDEVEVTGMINWYQGDPAIYITNPSQISTVN